MRQRLSRTFAMLMLVAGALCTTSLFGCFERDYCRKFPSHCAEEVKSAAVPERSLL